MSGFAEMFYQRLKEELETKYNVVVLDEAIVCAEDLIHQISFCAPFPGETSEEQLRHLLTEACCVTVSRIHGYVDVKELDRIYYNLCQFLVEKAELVKEDADCSEQWIHRLCQELDTAEMELLPFFQGSWDPSLDVPQLIQNLETSCRLLRNKRSEGSTEEHSVLETADWSVVSNHLYQFLSLLHGFLELIRQKFLHIVSVDHSQVEEVVSRSTGIPIPQLPFFGKLIPQYPIILVNKFPEVERQLNEMVVGQNHVVKGIIKSLQTLNSEEDWQRRYRRVFLFLGPSGVGKKQLAKAIALYFYGDLDRLIQIDMSVLTKSDLLRLADDVVTWPSGVILFDKIEEADPVVLENIAGILARGCGFGFCKTVIMTSGVGSEHFRRPKSERFQRVVDEARKVFKPELMNLMNGVFVFDMLYSLIDVTRLLIRNWASANGILVYPSDDILFTLLLENNLNNGHEIKKWVAENIFPTLNGFVMRTDKTCAVYVDTLVGSSELSFRLGLSSGDLAEDWYFKRTGKSLRKLIAIYRTEREVINLTLKLASICSVLKDKVNVGMVSAPEVHEVVVPINSLKDLLLPYQKSLCLMSQCHEVEVMPPCREIDNRQTEKGGVKLLINKLQARIKGQNLPINIIADCVLRSANAPADPPSRPSGIYLLLGLDCAEKDKLMNDVAEHVGIIEGKKPLVQVDLSDSSSSHSLLSSAPPNRSCPENDTSVVEAVRRWPYSVVVFDKIEKVNALVYNSLLQVLDTGILHCLDGATVDFRNTTIILISDIADKELIAKAFDPSRKTIQQLGSRFRSELLNRVNDVIFFQPTSEDPNNFISLYEITGCSARILPDMARDVFRTLDMSDEQLEKIQQSTA